MTNPPGSCPYFVANNAVDSVLTAYKPATNGQLFNADNHKTFRAGDNFTIISAGFIMPESYTLWKNMADIAPGDAMQRTNWRLWGTSGDLYTIDGLGSGANIFFPMESYELILDININVPAQRNLSHSPGFLTESFYLEVLFTSMKISQRGQPAAFNTKEFIITPFIKIAHNFPLT